MGFFNRFLLKLTCIYVNMSWDVTVAFTFNAKNILKYEFPSESDFFSSF